MAQDMFIWLEKNVPNGKFKIYIRLLYFYYTYIINIIILAIISN